MLRYELSQLMRMEQLSGLVYMKVQRLESELPRIIGGYVDIDIKKATIQVFTPEKRLYYVSELVGTCGGAGIKPSFKNTVRADWKDMSDCRYGYSAKPPVYQFAVRLEANYPAHTTWQPGKAYDKFCANKLRDALKKVGAAMKRMGTVEYELDDPGSPETPH